MKIRDLFDVAARVVLVTGGASGIGLACAEILAENGANVTILDRDPDALDRACDRWRARGVVVGGEQADVTDRAALRAAVDRVHSRHGRLDVVFANAGIGGGPGFEGMTGARNPAGAIENVAIDHWRRNLATNLRSVIHTFQAVVPLMKAQRPQGGRIIVTASVAGLKTENFVGHPYIAAKAGVLHLVRQTALELARYDILVNAIAPGSFLTNIGNGRMADPIVQERFRHANPMHRLASTDEIKGLALYLASPASSYMTGALLPIDGGASAGMADETA